MSVSETSAANDEVKSSSILTAGQMVYSIPHIRRQIIKSLSPSSLAKFITVEKGCMEEVARELYSEITFELVKDSFSDDPIREKIYSDAVTLINAKSLSFTLAMRKVPGWECFDRYFRVKEYDPVVFNFIVPYFRHRFRGLRRIQFEGERRWHHYLQSQPDAWSVSFDGPFTAVLPISYDKGGYVGEYESGGMIELLANQTFDVWYHMEETPDLSGIRSPKLPRGPYTIRYRFNMAVENNNGEAPDAALAEQWSLAFREEPGFENLHTSVVAQALPITFDDLTCLYNRQISAGHEDRLQEIKVDALLPWEMSAFATFASVASASLTSLDIVGGDWSVQPTTTFGDVPALISIVRDHLPSLSKLRFGVKETAGAEDICKAFLTVDSLRAGGTVRDLSIQKWSPYEEDVESDEEAAPPVYVADPPPYNIVRVLSALCAPNAAVSIPGDYYGATEYLQYLRRQPLHCQTHLAVADFPSLGLANLRDVHRLSYDEDGRPYIPSAEQLASRQKTMQAERWSVALASFKTSWAAGEERIAVEREIASCYSFSASLDEMSATAPAGAKLAVAKQLLATMMPLKAEVNRLSRSLDVAAVREYVRSLEYEVGREVGRGGAEVQEGEILKGEDAGGGSAEAMT